MAHALAARVENSDAKYGPNEHNHTHSFSADSPIGGLPAGEGGNLPHVCMPNRFRPKPISLRWMPMSEGRGRHGQRSHDMVRDADPQRNALQPRGHKICRLRLRKTDGRVGLVGFFQSLDLFRHELDREGGDCIFQVMGFRGADNGGGNDWFREHPG